MPAPTAPDPAGRLRARLCGARPSAARLLGMPSCTWCGAEVESGDGFRAYEPVGKRLAVFCRLEHIIPWSIQGAHWEPGEAEQPSSRDQGPGTCSHCGAE